MAFCEGFQRGFNLDGFYLHAGGSSSVDDEGEKDK